MSSRKKRIGQIYKIILNVIRNPQRNRDIRDYYDGTAWKRNTGCPKDKH